jgi:GT2 family glycosyltransferase
VINNGSTDGTKEWLDDQKDLWVIHQDNLGGAGGFHRGIKEAYKSGYEFLWIMDDDVVPTESAIENLLKEKEFIEKPGFLCSLIRSDDGDTINVPTIDMRPGITGYATWGQYLNHKIVKVREATFVSVVIPRAVLKEIGLPIKEFFIWGDDIEFTRRITSKWNGYLIGGSEVIHRRAQNSTLNIVSEKKGPRLKFFFYLYRNTMYLKLKEKEALPIVVFTIKSFISIIKCLGSNDLRLTRINIIIKGVIAGLFFNPKIQGLD